MACNDIAIELTVNMFTVVLWFHMMCLVSFYIDELVPRYRRSDTMTNTWFFFLFETILIVGVFHLAIKLLTFIHSKLFISIDRQIESLPELWGMLTVIFAIIVFQKSYQRRAHRIFECVGRRYNKYDAYY